MQCKLALILVTLSPLHTVIPIPVVEIVTVGLAEPGKQYMLNCTISVVDKLIVSPVITWTKRSASNISVSPVDIFVSDTMMSLFLNFPSLNISDAGQYTCEASLNVSQIGIITRNNDSVNLSLESKSFFKALICCIDVYTAQYFLFASIQSCMIQSFNGIILRLHAQCNSQNVNTFVCEIHQPLKHDKLSTYK